MPTTLFSNPDAVEPFDPKSRPLSVPVVGPWAEHGYEDPVLKTGRWRVMYYNIREKDPLYYDPDIKDGILGPVGVDTTQTPEMHTRLLPSRLSFDEWRDRRYFLDPNVRAIYENYPIAKQHPGLMFRLTGSEQFMDKKHLVGNAFPSLGLIRHWPGILPRSWRFMGAPFGEQCHVKTAVAAKYAVSIGTLYFVYKASSMYLGHGWRKLLSRWLELNYYTVPVAAGWAAASCIAGSVRGKDDHWNMWYGGAAVGVVIGSKKGFFIGWYTSLVATMVGLFWYYFVAFEQDLIPYTAMTNRPIISWDPAAYKWLKWEGNWYQKPVNEP